MTSEAFCPGHITALFYVPDHGPTTETTGSRGAGVCISLGARARVTAERADHTSIAPLGDTRLSPVVAMALGEYLERSEGPVTVHLGLELDLPVGHGFGMSGAMTFAVLVAAEGELGLVGGDLPALLAHAHAAEVSSRTGLGDVVAQARGGIDLRLRHGLPPAGEVVTRRQETDLLVAWSEKPLHTREVISDPAARERLRRAAMPRLDALEGEPDIDWLLEAGWAFAREAGLVDDSVRRMVRVCSTHGRASQVILGNSVFAVGDLPAMGRDLDVEGYSWLVTRVDNRGVRLLG